jgi:protein TonB
MGGVIGGIIGQTTTTAVPKVATPQRVRVSQGVSEGLLVHQVKPVYPALARSARIQGAVVLQAVIGKDGSIQNLKMISGHPMLAPAAIEAVKQWKYKPYFLNGEPVEVDTQITVNFTLAGG